MEDSTQRTHRVSRRALVKGAAWSVPVIAVAAATPLAAASTTNADLVPSFSGPLNLNLTVIVPVATVNVVNTLTITNNGTTPSLAGATASVVYNPALLTLNIAQVGGITVLGSDGNYTITLPPIAPGASLNIDLGTTLDSLLTLSLLTTLLGGPQQTIAANVAGDDVTGNNSASSNIGITLL